MPKVTQLVSFVTRTSVVSFTFTLSCPSFCSFSHPFLLAFNLSAGF